MKLLIASIIASFILPGACAAAPANSYTLANGYSVTIKGTSNLHDWSETVNTVSGGCSASANTDGTYDLDAISIHMAVHSIKSDMGSVMNNNTYKALKSDANPEIIFTLTTPVKAVQQGSADVYASGNLTIAGVTRAVKMRVKIVIKDDRLIFDGQQTLNMSDYGVDPPTALFGTLKTGNAITIVFKASFIPVINS